MSECTHNCNTCGGCGSELTNTEKQKDILEEMKKFMAECESEEIQKMFENIAAEMDV